MRAFLETVEKDYLDDFVFISKYQLKNLDIEVIDFDGTNLSSLDKYNPNLKNDILIGSVEATGYFFKLCGIATPKYLGYPDELKKYLGRTITEVKFGEINSPYPYFLKPKNDVKLFSGSLVENEKSFKFMDTYYKEINKDTEMYLSTPINFVSEYRCFVHKGELKGIQYYVGDFKIFPHVKRIQEMILKYKSANVSYALDVGLVLLNEMQNFYETYLCEVNDFWAVGSYGLDAKIYVRMIIDRFQEIYKNSIKVEN